jgi:hypothetical protein
MVGRIFVQVGFEVALRNSIGFKRWLSAISQRIQNIQQRLVIMATKDPQTETEHVGDLNRLNIAPDMSITLPSLNLIVIHASLNSYTCYDNP